MKIVALCDVSGSMTLYARPFLAFLAGLMRADDAADAYLFHTRLVRITEALRDDDPFRALNRITLLADGFGGGSPDRCRAGPVRAHLCPALRERADRGDDPVRRVRQCPVVRSLAQALTRLRKRGCRILWLNPLKGWRDYEPVAACMAAALPHLDLFAPAATLQDLAALERELVRL